MDSVNELDELEKLGSLRMPLEPLSPANADGDESYQRRMLRYNELLSEFRALKSLKSSLPGYPRELTPEEQANRADYIKRFPIYMEERETYLKENDGFLETIDMVRAKLEGMEREFNKPETESEQRLKALMIERCELLNIQVDYPFRFEFDSDEKYNEALAKYEQLRQQFTKCQDEIALLQEEVPNRTHMWVEIFDERSKFNELDDEYTE